MGVAYYYVCGVVCVSVCWSQPWALITMDWSRCCLGYGLGWESGQGTIYYVGTWISPGERAIFFLGGGGCSCQFVVNYRTCLVCNRYSQRYLVDGNGDAYFYVCCYSCMYVQDKYSLLTYLWSALLLWYAAGSMWRCCVRLSARLSLPSFGRRTQLWRVCCCGRYQSRAAGAQQQRNRSTALSSTAFSSKCEQFLVFSRHRKINADLFMCAGTTTKPDDTSEMVASIDNGWAELAVYLLPLIHRN